MTLDSVSAKTNRILHILLVAFFFIGFRVWHLGVMQREEKLKEAEKPKVRTLLMRAERGEVCDRFHIPLAVNRTCYNATVYYGQIAQIPAVSWRTEGGKRVRFYPRREHVALLAKTIGEVLGLEPERTEDLIYAKASLFPHVPYTIKTHLTEAEFYRLKMLEKDFLGLHAEIGSERFYPQGKTACHILGTLGAISQKEYEAIGEELAGLQEATEAFEQGLESDLPPGYNSFDQVYSRIYELKEKAYTLGDRVGKSGIEGQFEEDLRGFWGLKAFEVDQKGQALRELPGAKAPIPGREIVLSISAELQQFAEELLCQAELTREGRSFGVDKTTQTRKLLKQPWIKGGAIVALDPTTGDVLACASYPRFDPNDFVGRVTSSQIARLFENDLFLAALWEGQDAMTRELWKAKKIVEEKEFLTWDWLLNTLLPKEGPLRLFFQKVNDVKSACSVQEDFETLRYFAKSDDPFEASPETASVLKRLEPLFGAMPVSDRLFAVDLCRLAVASPRFSDELLSKVGSWKLNSYLALGQAFHRLEKKLQEEAKLKFHASSFVEWRKVHQKEFLAQKRKQEKEKKWYAKPYLDYLDAEEQRQFDEFWEENRLAIVLQKIRESFVDADRELLLHWTANLSPELTTELLRTFRSFHELERPLFSKKGASEQDLVARFLPKGNLSPTRSYAFQASSAQGSVFKLIPAYEALRQGHHLTLIDTVKGSGKSQIVAYSLDQTPYPRIYKGGRLPRTAASNVGQVDVVSALEYSSNPYFSILAGDYLKNPEDLNCAAHLFGYGEKSGLELPGETAGALPTDLRTNRTGLYAYAIGQHTLLSTPIQTALMLAAFGNGGHLLKPKIVKQASGMNPSNDPFSPQNRFARKELDAIGIHFPLFTSAQTRTPLPSFDPLPTCVRRNLFLPPAIRNPLLEGMSRSIWDAQGKARPSLIRSLRANPTLMQEFLTLQHQLIGKTSTAEVLASFNANPSSFPDMYKHTWFGGIAFDPMAKIRWEHPELVVVVFLRYGDAGREAIPIAGQMVRKWRDIKARH